MALPQVSEPIDPTGHAASLWAGSGGYQPRLDAPADGDEDLLPVDPDRGSSEGDVAVGLSAHLPLARSSGAVVIADEAALFQRR